jgi:hypothetical protein
VTTETTTIHLARPTERFPLWQVFGNYDGPDDRHIFGLREYPEDGETDARRYAAKLLERHSGATLAE